MRKVYLCLVVVCAVFGVLAFAPGDLGKAVRSLIVPDIEVDVHDVVLVTGTDVLGKRYENAKGVVDSLTFHRDGSRRFSVRMDDRLKPRDTVTFGEGLESVVIVVPSPFR